MSLPEGEEINRPLLEEAERILSLANERHIILRIMGSIAFRMHCPRFVKYLDRMERKLTDVDFASYSRERDKVEKLLGRLGYVTQSYVSVAAAGLGRSIYWRPDNKDLKVDVFWDRLAMNHTIDFEGRLECDAPTLPLSELLQEKLQIVQLNLKDVKDTIVLLLEHEIAEKSNDREIIDLRPILKETSSDWGYYYTFTMNLQRIRGVLRESEYLSDSDRAVVDQRIGSMIDAIERVPKSLSWKLRARVGAKTKWYQEVQ